MVEYIFCWNQLINGRYNLVTAEKNMESQYIKGTLKVLGQKMCFNQSGQYKTAHCRLNMFEDLTFMSCFWMYAFLKTCRSAKQLMLPIYCGWLRKTLQETPRFARRKRCFPEFASLNRSVDIKKSTTTHDLTTRISENHYLRRENWSPLKGTGEWFVMNQSTPFSRITFSSCGHQDRL